MPATNRNQAMTDKTDQHHRKPFAPPRLLRLGQMDCIVMQSPPSPPSSAWRGGGTARTRAPGEFTWE